MSSSQTSLVRFGIQGFGFSGRIFHAPVIPASSGCVLTAVQSSRSRGDLVSEGPHHNGLTDEVAVLAKLDEAFFSLVDVVVITAPNTEHGRLAKLCLLAGKHVVIEKPVCVTSAEAEEVARLAGELGLTACTYHNRRLDSDFLTLRAHAEQLGPVHYLESRFDRYRPAVRDRWRERPVPGSGALYDLGSHLIDQAIVLLGLPDTVYAEIDTQRAPAGTAADDMFLVVMGFEGKARRARAVLTSSALVAMEGRRLVVHGDKGSFVSENLDTQEDQLKAGLQPSDAGDWGAPLAPARLTVNGATASAGTVRGAYHHFYEQLARAIRGEGPAPSPVQEGARVIKVIEAAIESAKTGAKVHLTW
jgi:scyllo-inositol 2-dehydrogenase (NADP+)